MTSWPIRRLPWVVCFLGVAIVAILVGWWFDLWIVSGLFFDIIGFGFLALDLLLLQRDMKKRANENISAIKEFSENYGGIQSWSREIERRASLEDLSDLANCVGGLDEELTNFFELFKKNSERERQSTSRSRLLSWCGFGFVFLGFSLQIVGVLYAYP